MLQSCSCRKLRLIRQPVERLRKALAAATVRNLKKKAQKWPFRSLYLGVEMRPEAQKLPVNPIREYYHPAKFGPQPVSLAQVMRSM